MSSFDCDFVICNNNYYKNIKMKNLFFASLFAVLFIFSYSCQDGENNQIENPQTQGIKKSSPDGEEIYNNIVNFRKKLLTKDYKAGESISTDEAILLMEASLNLTYGVRKDIESIEGESAVLNLDFGSENTEYSKIYASYEKILEKLREIFSKLEGENKKFVAVDLNYDSNRNEFSIRSAISKSTKNIISDCELPSQEILFKNFIMSNKEITDKITSIYGREDGYFCYAIDYFKAPHSYPSANSIYVNIPTAVYDSMAVVMEAHPALFSDLTYFVVDHLAWKVRPDITGCDINNVLIKKCYAVDRGIGEFAELLFEDYYPLTNKNFIYATGGSLYKKNKNIGEIYGDVDIYHHNATLYFAHTYSMPEPVVAEDIFSDWNDIEN